MTYQETQTFSLFSLTPSAHPILVPLKKKMIKKKHEERKQAAEEGHFQAPRVGFRENMRSTLASRPFFDLQTLLLRLKMPSPKPKHST